MRSKEREIASKPYWLKMPVRNLFPCRLVLVTLLVLHSNRSDGTHEVLLLSAHADAFNAAQRRIYTEALIDWAQARAQSSEVFIAGDFNFELKAANETNLYTDNVKHDSESYSHILRYFRDLGRAAGDTAINDRRIDYIFGPATTQTDRASRSVA